MNNVNKLHQIRSISVDAIRDTIDAGVRVAFARLTDDQLKELMMAPYRELHAEVEMRKAA